jgi:hypothetical protein
MDVWGFAGMIVDAAHQNIAVFGMLQTALWPARHALLALVLVLLYVHGGFVEPESEDPTLF